jgi:hypothetical protein
MFEMLWAGISVDAPHIRDIRPQFWRRRRISGKRRK